VSEAKTPSATDHQPTSREIKVPAMGLVVLIGVSSSGKSTFAARHFAATQVVSSDFCRALVSDDENDLAATADAFDVLGYIVGTRLRRGLLTVVDATSVQSHARAALVKLAKDNNVMVDAIVLDVPVAVATARHAARTDRSFGAGVIRRQHSQLQRSLKHLHKEGFRRVHVLTEEEIDQVRIVPEASWNDRRSLTGPFDIVGDVHGCLAELLALLDTLGWEVQYQPAAAGALPLAVGAKHPEGRTAIFVGDLVDRGPDTPGVLRLVMGMVAEGSALAVMGNHEARLVRALKGKEVKVQHGLAESLAQLDATDQDFQDQARGFMDGLIGHYWLDGGRLVVAHAGLKEAYHGRSSGRVRAFALYGDTTGETDQFGLPVRYPWAEEYRGQAAVVYGHTPTPAAEWINNTICVDTGVVFGGQLTALRYPERELVQVAALEQYCEPVRPLATPSAEREPTALNINDVAGTRWLVTQQAGKVKIPEANATAALEVMSRFAIDPRWLIYLPPTMSPAAASQLEGFLEHPDQAFEEYAKAGVQQVVCEEKHMGSRAVAVIAKDVATAQSRFGVADGSTGAVFTRTGRAFYDAGTLVNKVRSAIATLFDVLDSDWLALDCELLPWSAKALGLIKEQYASVGAAAHAVLPAASALLEAASARGLDVAALAERVDRRTVNAEAYRQAYAAYVLPTDGLEGVTLAPFQLLAAEGRVLALTESHQWHLDQVAKLTDPLITQTRYRLVDLADQAQRREATQWWLDLTQFGGEGMVVKPLVPGPADRRLQPGLKVRGKEYLRIIYGPDYLDALPTLRGRTLGHKQSLALREHALGLEALAKFVAGGPLWAVHQLVFAVLALESQPVDPRL